MAQYTPVRPRSGGLVHATSLTDAHRTQCGKIAAGWVISMEKLSCQRCKELLHMPVKPGAKGEK
jgi:hypothetical protein